MNSIWPLSGLIDSNSKISRILLHLIPEMDERVVTYEHPLFGYTPYWDQFVVFAPPLLGGFWAFAMHKFRISSMFPS